MNNLFYILLLVVLHLSCKTKELSKNVIKGENYEFIGAPNQKAVLILFPCFPCDIENTKAEAGFIKDLDKEGISLLLMNQNQKLFLSDEEKVSYAKLLNTIFEVNNIKQKSIFIGGFSSGGNIALVLSNYLNKSKNKLLPSGVFVVDSPLDLEALYQGAKKEVEKSTNEEALYEAKFLIDLFETKIGTPINNIEKYKTISPFLISQKSVHNIEFLVNTKVRFYTEPDLEWQKTVKQRKYEDLNAYKCEQTHKALLELGSKKSEFIATQNRGFRANGQKHPHSWSIVERSSLIKWILE